MERSLAMEKKNQTISKISGLEIVDAQLHKSSGGKDEEDTIVLPDHNFHDDEPLPGPPAATLPNSRPENISIQSYPESAEIAALYPDSYLGVNFYISASPQLPVRAPIDIVAVLDVSGSMSNDKKLSLLQSAAKSLIDHMLPSDRLSIISFSKNAERIMPLRRMTDISRKDAKCAVDLLGVNGRRKTNIVAGLNMGVGVLEQRRECNPISIIVLLSDGLDTDNNDPNDEYNYITNKSEKYPNYLGFLSSSIYGGHSSIKSRRQRQRFPVYTFGVGYGHNRVAMEAIANGSGGSYSSIESCKRIRECIGGSVFKIVGQDACVEVTAARGVEISDIQLGSSILRKKGIVYVGDLLSEKAKKFTVRVSVPVYNSMLQTGTGTGGDEEEAAIWKTPLLNVVCYYHDVLTNKRVQVHGPRAEIMRPVNCCCYCCGVKVRSRRTILAWFCCWVRMFNCE